MTDEPVVDEPVVEETEDVEVPAAPEISVCRHCGQPHELAPDAGADWLCPKCEHYQDQTLCPTCGQVARLSLMSRGAS